MSHSGFGAGFGGAQTFPAGGRCPCGGTGPEALGGTAPDAAPGTAPDAVAEAFGGTGAEADSGAFGGTGAEADSGAFGGTGAEVDSESFGGTGEPGLEGVDMTLPQSSTGTAQHHSGMLRRARDPWRLSTYLNRFKTLSASVTEL
ncbi:hypothetical protein GCM10020229_45650 [Kitasatospora albolonga]